MTEIGERAAQDMGIPLVPLAPYELVSLDNILMSYQMHLLRPVLMMEQEKQHFTHIMNLRRRFGRLIRPGMAVGDELIELNEGELETVIAALKMFTELVSRLFPYTRDREMALEAAQHFHQLIANIAQKR